MGFSAGETSPPNLLPSAGRKLSVLIFSDRNVFAITRQSAPACFGRLADRDDVAGVGRQLHPQRLLGLGADRADAVAGVVLVHREVAARLVAGRARDVRLDHIDVRHAQLFGERGEILDRLRVHADHQRRLELRVFRYDVIEEVFDAFARQSDRLDDPGFRLGHSRGRIAQSRLAADGLCDQRAEPVEIDDVVVFPGEGAGRRLHRILQRDVADLDREIYHPTASCMLNTGPSRQTRLSTFLPSTSKVRMQT